MYDYTIIYIVLLPYGLEILIKSAFSKENGGLFDVMRPNYQKNVRILCEHKLT